MSGSLNGISAALTTDGRHLAVGLATGVVYVLRLGELKGVAATRSPRSGAR
jgi:hypothetical protein